MSQKYLSTTKKYHQAYQPLPIAAAITPSEAAALATLTLTETQTSSIMDNPALTRSTNNDDASIASVGGTLPSTYSSQQLMATSSESDSFGENGDGAGSGRLRGGGISSGRRAANATGLTGRGSLWFTVAVLCFVNLINYMDRYTIAGVLTDIQKDFNIGDDNGGLLQTAFVLSYMICAPIFGYLGDRYSRPWIMAVGVLLWSTTTLLGSFMKSFGWFITFRALVGIGEASYSTIAPTIISDLFVHDMRSKMLALFYFAIPVGSGFGYIVGSETARLANNWRWALRVTPLLGLAAVVLIMLIKDPERGESEGSHNLEPTTYSEDIKDLLKNRSFMLSTAGFTCVAFVTGALAWWGPKFMYLGIRLQQGNENLKLNDVTYKFGVITMIAGLIGVPMGSYLSQYLLKRFPSADPLICGFGLITSVPLMTGAMIVVSKNTIASYALMFFGELALNLNWAIVADILLYVVVPTRRSTAEAFQILFSHALGDAGSPYLVGVLSEAIKKHLRSTAQKSSEFVVTGLASLSLTLEELNYNATTNTSTTTMTTLASTTLAPEAMNIDLFGQALANQDTSATQFEALQYALFSTSFVEVVGGIFFLLTAAFIIKDKQKAMELTRDGHHAVPNHPPVDVDEIS